MANKKIGVILAIIIIGITLFAGLSLFFFFRQTGGEFKVVPIEKIEKPIEVIGTEVGIGCSTKESPQEAAREAINMALKDKKDKTPDFAVIFASSGSDMETILSQAREFWGKETKIYGGSSDSRGVMTNHRFIRVTERGYEQELREGRRGLVIMTVSSKDIVFGVGSADLSRYASVKEAAKEAIIDAIKNAGKSPAEAPRAILTLITPGVEDEALAGIEEVVGKGAVILGGTTGGPKFSVLGQDKVYDKGFSLAVIYTDLPIGWTFEGGFDVAGSYAGTVTKVDGQAIVEIDNRPALDVYNEWLDGDIDRLYKEVGRPDVIRDLLVLHPIYRKYTSSDGQDYFLFSHPWPKDNTLKDRSVMTSTNIKSGEKIYLSRGAWETFVNRIGNLPRNAKAKGRIDINKAPILGIGYICGGIMGVIPETEREKLAILINYANNSAPFIATFTWGEQGYFPGIGSKHGNLLTSFLVIGPKEQK